MAGFGWFGLGFVGVVGFDWWWLVLVGFGWWSVSFSLFCVGLGRSLPVSVGVGCGWLVVHMCLFCLDLVGVGCS